MMKFWKKYPGKIIKIDYDKFVMDYENSKSVIKDLGLKWENKILRFYENRSVETNSLLQVEIKFIKIALFMKSTTKV